MSLAVVSGGGTGIGAAVARTLAQDHTVAIIGRRAEVLRATAARVGAVPVVADLTFPSEVERAAEDLGPLGKVDVLAHCAGVLSDGPSGGLADVAQHWLGTFAANVLPAVLLTQALSDRLSPHGCVVAVGSIAAQRGGHGAYSAAKAALHMWALDQARTLAPVRVNVISPGYVEGTELFPDGRHPQHDARVAQTLTGRAGTPQDIADAVRWLVSARQVTGQVVSINGGALIGR